MTRNPERQDIEAVEAADIDLLERPLAKLKAVMEGLPRQCDACADRARGGQGHAVARSNRHHRKRLCPHSDERPWLADFLHELTVFPNGRYDDQVDSTAQALAWAKMRPPGWGVLEYYRLEAAKLKAENEEKPMVRMLAPVGVGALYTFTGRNITIPNDRIIEVSAEDAGPLMRAPGWTEVAREAEAVG
jgi:hypothetical protein